MEVSSNDLEETLSTLGLSVPGELNELEFGLEDIEEMSKIIKEQIDATRTSLQNLITRHIPVFLKNYSFSDEIQKNVDSINDEIDRTVKFLSSVESPNGCHVQFIGEQELLKKKLVSYQSGLDRIQSIKEIYDKVMSIRKIVACGEIDQSTDLMLAVEKAIEILFEESPSSNISEKENVLPGLHYDNFDYSTIKDALILEAAKTHAHLMIVVKETWKKMITIQESDMFNKVTVKKYIVKTAIQVENSNQFNLDFAAEEPFTDNVSLYTLIVALLRLNCLGKFVADDLGNKFFQQIIVPVFNLGVPSFADTKDERWIKVDFKAKKVTGNCLSEWEHGTGDIESFHSVLDNTTKCIQWLASCFLEEDSSYFDFEMLALNIWGNPSRYLQTSISTGNTDSIIGLTLFLLYRTLPAEYSVEQAEHYVSLHGRLSEFESSMEKCGLITEKKSLNILSSYVRTIECAIIGKFRNKVLLKAKDIISGDYYKTMHLSPEVLENSNMDILNYFKTMESTSSDDVVEGIGVRSVDTMDISHLDTIRKFLSEKMSVAFKAKTNQDENDQPLSYFSELNRPFGMSEMIVSQISFAIINFIHDLMDKVVLGQKVKAASREYVLSVCSLSRDIFFLFYTLVDRVHEKVIRRSPKYGAVFFNDCEFICHIITTLSYKYAFYMPVEASSNMILFDLIPQFRTKARKVLDDLLLTYKAKVHTDVKQKEEMFSNADEGVGATVAVSTIDSMLKIFTKYIETFGEDLQSVLSNRVYLFAVGILIEHCLSYLSKILFSWTVESWNGFNVLELIELKSKIQNFLSFLLNEALVVGQIKVTLEVEVDSHLSIGKIVPTFMKFHQVENHLNETLSREILMDLKEDGKLYLLTNEEADAIGNFLFGKS